MTRARQPWRMLTGRLKMTIFKRTKWNRNVSPAYLEILKYETEIIGQWSRSRGRLWRDKIGAGMFWCVCDLATSRKMSDVSSALYKYSPSLFPWFSPHFPPWAGVSIQHPFQCANILKTLYTVRFLNLVRPFLPILPEVSSPDRKVLNHFYNATRITQSNKTQNPL